MTYEYDKDLIKSELTLEQIQDLLFEWDGEPELRNNIIVSKTICHCGQSHKLYYYPNTTLFKCYTDCGETFDIYQLTQKVMSREQPKSRKDPNWNLPEAIDYIARHFGYAPNENKEESQLDIKEDLRILEKYDRINNIDINTQEIELKKYDDTFLKYLPHPIIKPWLDEGISQKVIDTAGICYDPKNNGIVIPHRDINNRLVGVRERTLIKEQAEQYGKYMPARIGGNMFNHPLSFNLYNLNMSKNNIQQLGKAFVFESEKSCLKYRSYFGGENDISCAVCGSSFIQYQCWLLINHGAKEIIVGFDHDFTDLSSESARKIIKNLQNIHKKYGQYINISFLWDKNNLLGYKDSPVDKGKEIFLDLYKNRVMLY